MVRVLFVGDICGKFPLLCETIQKINAKLGADKAFEVAFCVGCFSSEDLDLDAKAPIPIYFVDAGPAAEDLINESPGGETVSENLHFLGHYGVTKVSGLNVAFLSGRRDPEAEEQENCTELFKGARYTPLVVERLLEDLEGENVDILLTSEWPTHYAKLVKKEDRPGLTKLQEDLVSEAVALVAEKAEAKYHAAGLARQFFKRPPWRHRRRGMIDGKTGEMRKGVCRFIGLGAAPGTEAESLVSTSSSAEYQVPKDLGPAAKWWHGLEINPNAAPTDAPDATDCPFGTPEEGEAEVKEPEEEADKGEVWRPSFGMADKDERKRWMSKYGATPDDLCKASEKEELDAQKAAEDAFKKKRKHESIYDKWRKIGKKNRGKGYGDSFNQKEKRAANSARYN